MHIDFHTSPGSDEVESNHDLSNASVETFELNISRYDLLCRNKKRIHIKLNHTELEQDWQEIELEIRRQSQEMIGRLLAKRYKQLKMDLKKPPCKQNKHPKMKNAKTLT